MEHNQVLDLFKVWFTRASNERSCYVPFMMAVSEKFEHTQNSYFRMNPKKAWTLILNLQINGNFSGVCWAEIYLEKWIKHFAIYSLKSGWRAAKAKLKANNF